MRRNILMLSQNTHAFLINEIKYAAEVFDRVVVICPKDEKFESALSRLELSNIETIFYSKKTLYKNAFLSFHKILEMGNRKEIIESIISKTLTKEYMKHYIYFLASSKLLNSNLCNDLKLSSDESKDWVFYSAWYYGTAYAITEAKKKYPHARTISLAHSFEVDKIKNKYCYQLFRKSYHEKLDKVSFISNIVYENYMEDIANKLKLSLEKCEVRYLGVRKLIPVINERSTDGVMRILSCSHVIPVKRVDLIFKVLEGISKIQVEWTHIGSGEQIGYIKDLINNKKNDKLTIKLMGQLENWKIHEYYANEPIDLFINLSKSEGIPVTIMEAISYEVPIIATNVGGNSEIVKKEFGVLVSSDPTIREVREAILSIYNYSEEKIELMRNSAGHFYNNYFNSDYIRKDFFDLLRKDKNEDMK